MVEIVRDKADVGGEIFVEFLVFQDRGDARVMGAVSVSRHSGPDSARYVKGAIGKPVEEAWADAKFYAASRGIKYIVVTDADGLFDIPQD